MGKRLWKNKALVNGLGKQMRWTGWTGKYALAPRKTNCHRRRKHNEMIMNECGILSAPIGASLEVDNQHPVDIEAWDQERCPIFGFYSDQVCLYNRRLRFT